MDALSVFTPLKVLRRRCITPPVIPQHNLTLRCPACKRNWTLTCGFPDLSTMRGTLTARWCDDCLKYGKPVSKLLGPSQYGCTSCTAEWEAHNAPDKFYRRRDAHTPTSLRFNRHQTGLSDIQYHGKGADII